MTCLQVREKLVECWGVEEELGARERAHLSSCPKCRREATLLRKTRALLAGMQRVSAPEGFCAQVMQQVAAAHARRWAWPERARQWLWNGQQSPAWGRALALAAVVMLMVAGFAVVHDLVGPPQAAPQVPAAIAAGSGAGSSVFSDEDLEALVQRHLALELSRALSDDPGVHMVSYGH